MDPFSNNRVRREVIEVSYLLDVIISVNVFATVKRLLVEKDN